MKRFLLWFSIILVGCCSLTSVRDTRHRTSVVDELKESTVAFVNRVSEIDPTLTPYCTGVWISKTHILTAKHCVIASNPLFGAMRELQLDFSVIGADVEFMTHQDVKSSSFGVVTHSAKIVAVDAYQDIAVVQVSIDDVPLHATTIIAEGSPSDGDSIHIVGHTMGLWWTYMRGYVSATRSTMFDAQSSATKVLQVSAPVYMGNSGGGAFNEAGDLVGIASWISTKSPNTAFFIHRDEITTFLRRNRISL